MPTLQEIQNDRTAFLAELRGENDRHERETKRISAALAELKRQEALLLEGLDVGKIALARSILYVEGRVSDVRAGRGSEGPVRAAVVRDTRADLAAGGERLRRGYLGVKNYDAFGDQRCDCEYGMGPRHGSIVFAVGLTRSARERDLTPDEIEAGLYLLATLERQEKALAASA